MVRGIDVSAYQGDINWSQVKDSDVDFAFVKATEGLLYTDAKFIYNWQSMKDEGITRGVYHFVRPLPGNGSIETTALLNHAEAQVVKMHKVVGNLSDGDLCPVIDLEETGAIGKDQWMMLSRPAVAYFILSLCLQVKKMFGVDPIIYSRTNWLVNNILSRELLVEYPLWLAQYSVKPPVAPKPWTEWRLWQYSAAGRVAGIHLDVDMNVTTVKGLDGLLVGQGVSNVPT